MDDTASSIIKEDEEESSGRYLYFRGRPLRTTGKTRSRYESSEDQIPIDYSRPLGQNIREALAQSINAGVEESGASKQIRLNHLNNLVRLIEKGFRNNATRQAGDTRRRRSFKDQLLGDGSEAAITYEQILICLRCLLTDDEREVRASALRVLRYLIQSEDDLKVALRLHLDVLIARSLDLVLDNRLERNQCIRLLISLIHYCPLSFPSSLVHLLLTICLDGQEENDKLARAATAALCELVILNSDLVLACGGLTWLIRSILMSGQSTSRLAECLTTVLSAIYNQRRNRTQYGALLKNVFYDLMAPLMDEHFKLSGTDKEEKSVQLKAEAEQVLENCRSALVAALRTWPGLIGCFSSTSSQGAAGTFLQSPVYALVASLCLDSEKIREFAVEAICEILSVSYQNEHWDSWEKTLEVADCIPLDEYKYSLTIQFANADANALLGDWNMRRRPNLTAQTIALVLLGLVDAGVISTLTRVIVDNPNRPLELKMTLILSDILEMCGRYLPSIYRQLALSLTSVFYSIYDDSVGQVQRPERRKGPLEVKQAITPIPQEVQKQNAMLLAYRLRTLASTRQRSKRVRTLQMENLISKFCYSTRSQLGDPIFSNDTESMNIGTLEKTIPRINTLRSVTQAQVARSVSLPVDARPLPTKIPVDRVHELVRDSRTTVPYSNYSAWDWSLIYLALCQMGEHRQHLEDSTCAKFTNQLIQFFDPAGGQYCKMSDDYRLYSRVGCALMKVLGSASMDSAMGVQLRAFLGHLVTNLLPDRLHVGQLSTKNILNGSCADYFVLIGQLSDTETGRLALERTGIMQRLVDLINPDSHDAYIKLVVSSMIDYDRPGMGRVLLQKALTSTKESARCYSTTFLLALAKLKIAGFAEWGMEMLINQLRDSSRVVVEEAARILEELVNDEEYLDSLIRLRPSLLPLGDAGILLLTYVMSNEQAVTAMIKQHAPQQKRYSPIDDSGDQTLRPVPASASHNFVGNEIERWKSAFNTKYARIVDERMCEAFSSYKRMADGSFPRHASRSSQTLVDVFVPPHLFGQLAKHATGCQLLQAHGCISPLLDTVHNGGLSSENDVLAMKAAMWALGHIASTELGYSLLPRTLIASFVKIAEECPTLTVRGCAFYVINLVAQSSHVARERLRQLGWEASSSCPSLSTFYQHQKRNSTVLSAVCRHEHSRRVSIDEQYVNTVSYENDADAGPSANLLSASVTSGGDILSSGSGSSPPRIPSPSIFIMTSPDASRKSSQAPQYVRRYRSHCSSGDAHSVLTCGSCELCRGPLANWAMSSSGGAGGVGQPGMASSVSSLAAVASPVKVQCCEPSPPETVPNERGEANGQDERKSFRSKSLGTADIAPATSPVSNFLAPSVVQKRDRTPSPKHSLGDRKVSVPVALLSPYADQAARHRLSDFTATYSILEETSADIDLDQSIPPSRDAQLEPSKIQFTDGFFTRLRKKPDFASEYVRAALGLKKVPLLPEDLPSVRGSLRRAWESRSDRCSEYVTDENASGIAAWRLLQKQQRERPLSLDAGVVTISPDVLAIPEPGVSRAVEIVDEVSISVDEEQSQSTLDNSFQGDQSPSLQRLKPRPLAETDTNVLTDVLSSEKPVFMCLPLDIGLICNVTDWPPHSSTAAPNDSVPQLPPQSFYPARNHIVERCLHCRPFITEDSLMSAIIGCQQSEKPNDQAASTDMAVNDQQKQQQAASSTQTAGFRKELMRLVTLLCVRKKYAEQGLLRLKQEAPQLFRSLCVYCDVCYIMSTFTFRLSARRFLQELFQDVDLSELWTEPRRLLLSDQHHYHHHRLPSAPTSLN